MTSTNQELSSFTIDAYTTGSVADNFNSMSFLPPTNLTVEVSTPSISTSTTVPKPDTISTTYPSPPFTSFQSTPLSTTAAATSDQAVTGGSQPSGKKYILWKVFGVCLWLSILVAVK